MVSLWEHVLSKRPMACGTTFLELGGHSLLAVRLTSRIEKQFGKKLTITALIQAPTVESLVSLCEEDIPRRRRWCPLQTAGSKPIFFFVHGLGGTVMRFHELARHMVPDQPFYCFQAQGMDGEAALLDRVEEYGCFVFGALARRPARKAIFLGGYSFGGLVALEMARRLVETAGRSKSADFGRYLCSGAEKWAVFVRKVLRALDRTKAGLSERSD